MLALAPDAGSTAAGRKLAAPGPWSATGSSPGTAGQPGDDAQPAVWGLCSGSGKNPYQTVVDLGGPAFRCSCPSRKFPCKHALGLLLLWSAGGVAPGGPPDWAASWLADRAGRAAARPAADAGPAGAPDPAAAARRVEQRAARVAGGVEELATWLADQVRGGLAGLERSGHRPFDAVAARMVDAQAPGLAARLRDLPGVVAGGAGWPGRLLEELAQLHLTVAASRRLDRLPPGLAACVSRELGVPVAREDVLATAPVRDEWSVVGLRDSSADRLTTRRVWLHGARTGRTALVLSFAPPGQAPDATLVPGTALDADLHFHPGSAPLRAVVGTRHGEPRPLPRWAGGSLDDAARAFAAAVAADPWTTSWPVLLAAVTPLPAEPRWVGVDATGGRVPLLGEEARWRLLAVSGGRPVPLAAECTATGIRPVSVLDGDRLVLL